MNISKIETFMNDLIDNKVSDNTFFTDLPQAIEASWGDMVVVDCSSAISDMDGCGKGKILLFLYARPRSDGGKNVAKLSDMEKRLNECVESNTSKKYIINRASTYADYDESRNLHCNIVVLNLIIV